MSVLAQGAEAIIRRDTWHGREVVVKERVKKAYRSAILDKRLRNSRVKAEAQLMSQARKAGVMTPLIYDIDLDSSSITMEFVEGSTAKHLLQESENRNDLARQIGLCVGRLHRADIVHGDLTTSNMILNDGDFYFIDFGLGEKSSESEKKGVDMHLLKEALESAHSEHLELYEHVAQAYLEEYPEGGKILELVKEIEKRGRYT